MTTGLKQIICYLPWHLSLDENKYYKSLPENKDFDHSLVVSSYLSYTFSFPS